MKSNKGTNENPRPKGKRPVAKAYRGRNNNREPLYGRPPIQHDPSPSHPEDCPCDWCDGEKEFKGPHLLFTADSNGNVLEITKVTNVTVKDLESIGKNKALLRDVLSFLENDIVLGRHKNLIPRLQAALGAKE